MILELQHRRPDGDVDTYHLKPGRRYHLGRGSACEVRILDLKLSRKHAALEFMEGEWKLIDLCSTNGCQLNGTVMVGTSPLREGHVIEIGQTALTIGPITAKTGPSSSSSGPLPPVAAIQEDTSKLAKSRADEHASYISDEFGSPAQAKEHASGALSRLRPPEAAPIDFSETVGTVPPRTVPRAAPPEFIAPAPPARRAPEPRRGAVTPVVLQAAALSDDLDLEDTVATVPPAAAPMMPTPATHLPPPAFRQPPPFVQPPPKPAVASGPVASGPVASGPVASEPVARGALSPTSTPPAVSPGANSEDRNYFITVLGRRMGPLSRLIARDLKSRELKGVLKPSDLDQYPQA